MKWSGKAIGGVVGASIGGPLGAGIGAAVGHLLADTDDTALKLHRILFDHHHFSESGPGMVVTPLWEARGLEGVDVTVKLSGGGEIQTEIVIPEARREKCEIPPFFLRYSLFSGEEAKLTVQLIADGLDPVKSRFTLELPGLLRRSSNNGPAREVMALLAAARAGGHPLEQAAVRQIRTWFTTHHPLNPWGLEWLKEWMKALRELELERLTPEKVAERVGASLDEAALERLLDGLVAGGEGAWKHPEARAWTETFARELGLPVPWSHEWPLPRTLHRAREILGVKEGTPLEEVRLIWRKRLQEVHPDRAADPDEATRRAAQLNAAWEKLRTEGA